AQAAMGAVRKRPRSASARWVPVRIKALLPGSGPVGSLWRKPMGCQPASSGTFRPFARWISSAARRATQTGGARATMSDDAGGSDNVVHLGTGDLVAIGRVLREMYAF